MKRTFFFFFEFRFLTAINKGNKSTLKQGTDAVEALQKVGPTPFNSVTLFKIKSGSLFL
jgi:hypothetical protein